VLIPLSSGDIATAPYGEAAAIRGDLEKAARSIGCDGVPGLEHEAKSCGRLRQIREMIKETEDKIEELCKQFPELPYLLTIPGFGPDVSARYWDVGDPDRFEKGNKY